MCVRNVFYPLVKLRDSDKSQILFDFGVEVKDRETFKELLELQKDLMKFEKLHLSRISWIQECYSKYDVERFEKFVSIPCGQCADCLKNNSRSWAFRILKEAELYENNYFITLTYDDSYLVPTELVDSSTGEVSCWNNLEKDAISKFNKKLKVYLNRKGLKSDFRFYGVGEYGSKTKRPHYHVIYFGLDIPDLKFESCSSDGNLYFSSKFLDDVWKKGHVLIGAVDVGSACYVARYCDKKKQLTKVQRDSLINKGIQPEFSVMSRNPGIGSYYLEHYIDNVKKEIYNIKYRGQSFQLSKYYSNKVKKLLPDDVRYVYESNRLNNSLVKIASDLCLSDSVDLINFRLDEENFKKSVVSKRFL